ncbi:hypothetical protein KXS12_25980 [Priestia filamentosa]|uniref:hypothetical protein n=1 Tax=Priestia filamentosa TaxID=1402861 RepID=UPI003F17E344
MEGEKILKFKHQKTNLEKYLNIISLTLLVILFLFLFVKWSSLPNNIPLKYDNEVVLEWGNKISALGLPVFATLNWIMFTSVENHPVDNINLGVFKNDNKTKELIYNRILVNIIKNSIVLILVFYSCKNLLFSLSM